MKLGVAATPPGENERRPLQDALLEIADLEELLAHVVECLVPGKLDESIETVDKAERALRRARAFLEQARAAKAERERKN